MRSTVPLLFCALTASACRNAETPPVVGAEVVPAAKQQSSADSGLQGSVTADASTTTTKSTVLPPPGMYTVSIADRSNNCAMPDGGVPQAPPQWITYDKDEKGAWTANLPVNTGFGTPGADRNFVTLEVGTSSESSLRPDRTCSWQVKRSTKVVDLTTTTIVVDIRAEYSDAVRCTLPRKPTSCARDAVVTYTLVRPFCASGCVAKASVLADAGVEATCTCP